MATPKWVNFYQLGNYHKRPNIHSICSGKFEIHSKQWKENEKKEKVLCLS